MVVKDCPVGAIHTFAVRTLRSLGYATRIKIELEPYGVRFWSFE